jgi:IPT/TIG domain
MGFGKVKCIFNNTYYMNATIFDSETIKCDSSPLHESFTTALEANNGSAPWYNISLTLNNGKETAPTKSKFTYYVDPSIVSVSPNLGPLKGGTVSRISGEGFAQDGVCNLTVRYGPIQQKVSAISDTEIDAVAPEADVPDSVVISVALNGQQFIRDKTLHYRDVENTYTYYQDLLIHDFSPKSGPISGKTRITVTGLGFTQFKKDSGEQYTP